MQTITSTLLAAAQSLHGTPTVRCTLHRTARRWTSLYQDGASAACKVAAVWVGDTLYRYRVSASGDLQQQAIANPAADSAWSTWTTINSEPAASMDVALGYEPGHFRLVYQDASQGVRVLEGTDGTTWGSPATLTSPGTQVYLAAASQDVLILSTELNRYTRGWSGGAWSSASCLSGGPWALRQGLAAALDAANDRLLALMAVDNAMHWVAYDRTGGGWGSPRALEPRGDAGATDGAAPCYPDLIPLTEGFMATWQSRHTGTPTWMQEVALYSPDGDHFGYEAPLQVDSIVSMKLALAQHATTKQIIAGHDTAVLTCDAYALDDADAASDALTPLSYRYCVEPTGGATLSLRLLDADRALDPLGDGADALAPLNQIVLSRGWVTSAGEERVDLPSMFIVRAERTEGKGAGVVDITAVDSLGLLAMLRPWWLAEYGDRTIAWLLSEVAALGGVTCETDGDGAFSTSLSAWQLASGRSLAAALDDLLSLAGAVATVDEDGVIQATVWDDSPTAAGDLGDAGEILGGAVGLGPVSATGAAVIGDGASVLVEDVDASMRLGLRRLTARCDWRATSSALATAMAGRTLALAGVAGGDELVVPLRPDLELWDVLDVTLPSGSVVQRRVVKVEERWESGKGVYESRVGVDNT